MIVYYYLFAAILRTFWSAPDMPISFTHVCACVCARVCVCSLNIYRRLCRRLSIVTVVVDVFPRLALNSCRAVSRVSQQSNRRRRRRWRSRPHPNPLFPHHPTEPPPPTPPHPPSKNHRQRIRSSNNIRLFLHTLRLRSVRAAATRIPDLWCACVCASFLRAARGATTTRRVEGAAGPKVLVGSIVVFSIKESGEGEDWGPGGGGLFYGWCVCACARWDFIWHDRINFHSPVSVFRSLCVSALCASFQTPPPSQRLKVT